MVLAIAGKVAKGAGMWQVLACGNFGAGKSGSGAGKSWQDGKRRWHVASFALACGNFGAGRSWSGAGKAGMWQF